MNITEAQAREAVYQRWKAQWDVLHAGFYYVLENEIVVPEPTPPWARVTLRGLDAVQYTLGPPGNRVYRRESAIWVQLFTSNDGGIGTMAGLIDNARSVFEGATFGGVDPTGAGRTVTVGSDGRWYQVAVIFPVAYYEQR